MNQKTENTSTFAFGLSLFGKYLAIKILSLLLDFTLMVALSGRLGMILTQACDFVLLVALVYSSAWKRGDLDINRVQSGTIAEDRFRGLKAGLIAAIPDFAAAVCLLLAKAGVVARIFTSFYGLIEAQFMPFYLGILPQTLTVAEQPVWAYVTACALALVAPVVAGFGYYIGYRGISIYEDLMYATPEQKSLHRKKKMSENARKRLGVR